MNTLTYTMALLMGFTGSLHCAGMCGPIVWIMPFQAYAGIRKALALGLYHAGRISVYALLAVVLHSFRSLFNPAAQQYISILLGSALLLAGILSFLPLRRNLPKLPWSRYVKKGLSSIMAKPGWGTLAFAGMLNGLLPCGLVYMALSSSLTVKGTEQSALLMYTFGLGTLPMLVSISMLKTRLTFFRVQQFKRFAPAIVFVFGCLFILRGMNLDIPYLSPKVVVEQHGIRSCCTPKK